MSKVIAKKGNARVRKVKNFPAKIANRKARVKKGLMVPLAGLGEYVLANIGQHATDMNMTTEKYVRWWLAREFSYVAPESTPERYNNVYDPSDNVDPIGIGLTD